MFLIGILDPEFQIINTAKCRSRPCVCPFVIMPKCFYGVKVINTEKTGRRKARSYNFYYAELFDRKK